MKILQIIPYFVPAYGYGGPAKVCFDISKEMVKKGHSLTVVTTDVLDEKNRISEMEDIIGGIRVIRFKNVSNWLAKHANGYLPIGFYSWCKSNIQHFDIVHCHDFFTYQNIVTAHFCKKYGIPFIIQPHGTLSPIRQAAKFKHIKRFFLWSFKGVLTYSKSIIALTTNEKDEISAINESLNKKISIIPNGIRAEEFKNIKKIDLHGKFSIPKENAIIGYIGRLQFIKGIDISLEILARLKNKLPFTYLVIGPDDGERKKLDTRISELGLSDRVMFIGTLSGTEKLEVMRSCDLFLFTSRNEGLPMTVLEIAALGIPQIISKNCNVPELERYSSGSVFDLHEKKLISKRVRSLLSEPERIATMKSGSLRMIREVFDIQSISEKLEAIYLDARY